MHEMSLAEGILQLVEETARRENAQRVKTVVVEIGELSAVEPAALEFCFAAVAAEGAARGARLVIVDVPGSGTCLTCGLMQPMDALFGVCTACGSHRLQPTGGSEMRVREIEIE
ncbi:hydrogenase maturation nickel metallochaperone HypA [Dechloromonas sp. H13]|uniref:hydrogenase maturation nickel metallochaperone HypA n=1 Tax=Dechloromonas sp. H13 TaxID=2570193 RepID=UPI001292BBF7|nr:hydrogenase maturation nickel metallochaperone HypA [Dechloromonas sp. H13]